MKTFDKYVSGRMRPKLVEAARFSVVTDFAQNTCHLVIEDEDGKQMRVFMNAADALKLEQYLHAANAAIQP